MTTTRVSWENVRPLVEARIGPVRAATSVSEGSNSQIAAILETSGGDYFVKGLQREHPRSWTQERESAVNPVVRHLSPWLKWRIDADGWILLGFEYIAGKPADYSPGSLDLPKVMRTLQQLQQVQCPDIVMKLAEEGWASYTEMPELFAGDSLLHTDLHPTNFIINGRAYLVDWAWPTRGAGWIDPACWVIWLIASGHRPATAETWAARISSWSAASAGSITEFAWAQARMWAEIADESSGSWRTDLAHAAKLWAKYRESQGLTLARAT